MTGYYDLDHKTCRLRRMGTHIGSVLRCRQSEKKTSVYVLYADSDGFR